MSCGADAGGTGVADGYMSAEVYRNAFRYIAKTYFTQPNYYKAPTRLPNGTSADCCFFSLYQVCSPSPLPASRRCRKANIS